MKRRVLTNLDEEDVEWLEDKSRETGISLSALIRQAVKQRIKRERGMKCGATFRAHRVQTKPET